MCFYLSSSIFSVLCSLVYGNRIFDPVCSDSFSRPGWKRPEMAGKGRIRLDKLFPQGPGKPLSVLLRSSTITRLARASVGLREFLSPIIKKIYFEILKIVLTPGRARTRDLLRPKQARSYLSYPGCLEIIVILSNKN